ncbi:uncharacterized protein GGS22DRAFT_166038 [Annulohypoxylon maeteangense]|uniref:uncharacterized protein n=1 Tax=Annulohypoxylon maeteangense TaxID=1927788 RepID=UPI0020086A5A|nr:uncharacterized protein GGS22DRAFT_166038 [Annulohypoxylon maeteangense]KAI0883760.1 hypothetical protein GGS22DRAFT_166038 [Annulohypoxylon maeteangense]
MDGAVQVKLFKLYLGDLIFLYLEQCFMGSLQSCPGCLHHPDESPYRNCSGAKVTIELFKKKNKARKHQFNNNHTSRLYLHTPRNAMGKKSKRRPVPRWSDGKGQHEDPNGPIFFFRPKEAYGEFCQWYPARFAVSTTEISSLIGHPIDEDDPGGCQQISFNCAEQFMMYCKAGRFHDSEMQKLILETDDPKDQKALGRLTREFRETSWSEVKSRVVVAGNMAKFGQNPNLKGVLLGTGDRLLAEASSHDRVWGIGYTVKQAMAGQTNRESWGENRLGKALMEVRMRLREEQGDDISLEEDQG